MTPATVAASPVNTFDNHYDVRVGLPKSVGAAVARAIVERANAVADDLVVELGSGTGEIGAHLARLPVRSESCSNLGVETCFSPCSGERLALFNTLGHYLVTDDVS